MKSILPNKIEIASSPPAVAPRNDGLIKLLDVIAGIIAEEYIQVVKQNPETFRIASAPAEPRND